MHYGYPFWVDKRGTFKKSDWGEGNMIRWVAVQPLNKHVIAW
jgi:hypothetical protein